MVRLFYFLFFASFVISCSEEVFDLSIQVSGNGTYQISPQKSFYEDGETVTVTAIADSGWKFRKWEGGVQSNHNPLYLTMDGNRDIRLVFDIPFEPDISGHWNADQYAVRFAINQTDIFDSTITGIMRITLQNSSSMEYSVSGYNCNPNVKMYCDRQGYYQIIFRGQWINDHRIEGQVSEAGYYYECDLRKVGESAFAGNKFAFTPKKLDVSN